jgi:hypothetical protein
MRIGGDLYITSTADISDGTGDSGVYVVGWYAGNNSIEWFVTADNYAFQAI